MDTKRWDEMRSVFAREATLTDEDSQSHWKTRDGIVAGLASVLAPPVRTFHHGHMPEIEVLSDSEARGVWAMNDWVDTPTFTLDGQGHYHERYVFEDGAWRIAETRISRLRVERAPKAAAKAKRPARRAPAKKRAAKRPNQRGKKR
jgi:hypothetical protein